MSIIPNAPMLLNFAVLVNSDVIIFLHRQVLLALHAVVIQNGISTLVIYSSCFGFDARDKPEVVFDWEYCSLTGFLHFTLTCIIIATDNRHNSCDAHCWEGNMTCDMSLQSTTNQ